MRDVVSEAIGIISLGRLRSLEAAGLAIVDRARFTDALTEIRDHADDTGRARDLAHELLEEINGRR